MGAERSRGGDENAQTIRATMARLSGIHTAADTIPRADEELLGEGGMGAVHGVHQALEQRAVAVKRALDEHGVTLLVREARTMAKLEHPAIPTLYRLDEDDDGRPQIVMQRVHGKTWLDSLPDRALSGAELLTELERLLTVCNAVSYAHSKGVVHRDIKLENVMLGEYGEAYLLDWGLAFEPATQAPETHPAGTPTYMAPEMLGGDIIDARTDVYLLGALLHELLLGRPPHQHPGDTETTVPELLGRIALSEIHTEGLYGTAAEILTKALAAEPDDRYPSAEAFKDAINAFIVETRQAPVVQAVREAITHLHSDATDTQLADLFRNIEALQSERGGDAVAGLTSAFKEKVTSFVTQLVERNELARAVQLKNLYGLTLSDDMSSRLQTKRQSYERIARLQQRWTDNRLGRLTLTAALWIVMPAFWILPLVDESLGRHPTAADAFLSDVVYVGVGIVTCALVYVVRGRGSIRLIAPLVTLGYVSNTLIGFVSPDAPRTHDFLVWSVVWGALALTWRKPMWLACVASLCALVAPELGVSPNIAQAGAILTTWLTALWCHHRPLETKVNP